MYNAKLVLEFGLSKNVSWIQRDVYNAFMLLGDIGGFLGILFTLSAALVGLFTHNNPENFYHLYNQNV